MMHICIQVRQAVSVPTSCHAQYMCEGTAACAIALRALGERGAHTCVLRHVRMFAL